MRFGLASSALKMKKAREFPRLFSTAGRRFSSTNRLVSDLRRHSVGRERGNRAQVGYELLD
jgi:hypothetical protein